jgi:hypothetical protein
MELDKEKFRLLLIATMKNYRELETEILALRASLMALVRTFQIEGDPEDLIRTARNSPPIQNLMAEKYDAPLASFLQKFDKAMEIDEKILEFLRSWKPSAQPN